MEYTTVSELQWGDEAKTLVNMNVFFVGLGRSVPFTASSVDTEPHGVELFNRACDGDFGLIDDYVAPPEPIPQSVSWRQAQRAMLETPWGQSNVLDAVEALIAAMTDPIEKRIAQIEFNSPAYERPSAFLQGMWALLGGTESQLDDLFILASTK